MNKIIVYYIQKWKLLPRTQPEGGMIRNYHILNKNWETYYNDIFGIMVSIVIIIIRCDLK
jgi:hypothetical protein